jgi:hypothetical protein
LSISTTYRFTGKILSTPPGGGNVPPAGWEMINWNELVNTGSNHYMLCSIYARLRDAGLLGGLPRGLERHLEEIHSLNQERNTKILCQAREINDILRTGNIEPIFLKGLGNLADGLYADQGERMMHDLDILTGPQHSENAWQLLKAAGYKTHEKSVHAINQAMKHFPPLFKKGMPVQVEIHLLPVNIQYSGLFNYEEASNGKRPARDTNDLLVLSDSHNIKLNFIHSQLVHWGHQRAVPQLRDLYDLYLLASREDPAGIFEEMRPFRGKAAGYLRVMHDLFGVRKELPHTLKKKGKLFYIRHKTALDYPGLGRKIYRLMKVWRLYIDIPVKSLFSPNYRLYVKVRLKNPEWYKRNLGISLNKKTGGEKTGSEN